MKNAANEERKPQADAPQKKVFVEPKLERHETLPEVTGYSF